MDLLSRLSVQLFGPPANKVNRVEEAVEGVREEQEQAEEEGGGEGLDREEIEQQGVEEMDWVGTRLPPVIEEGRQEGGVVSRELSDG